MGAVKSVFRSAVMQRKKAQPLRYTQNPSTATTTQGSTPDNGKPKQDLLERLKVVYVESKEEPSVDYDRSLRRDKLPQDRTSKLEDEFYLDKPSPGHVTVQQVMDIFNTRRTNQEEWSAQKIAMQYGISVHDAETLLKYYNNYKLQPLPEVKPDMEFHPLHR